MSVTKPALEEHRGFERFTPTSPGRAFVRIGPDDLEARLVDISLGGAKIRLSRPAMSNAIQAGVEMNKTIFLKVFLPARGESHFSATIRWVQRFENNYIMGLEFLNPEAVDTMLAELIQ